ncbi:MAG: inositol monophosphatase [Alphaproteobacteria bacterium]|nr:inositol monophosphatase [Alphaproteobacteria bacterium]
MSYDVDAAEIEKIIAELAGRTILPRFDALQTHEIRSKTNPHDLVTESDIEMEGSLTAWLTSRYPGSMVVGEEAVAEGKADFGPLERGEGIVWVIDPLDGTYNFVHGRREFAVMVACVVDGETRYGWIHDVLSGVTGFAAKGEGAWIGGKRVRVAPPESIRTATGYINLKYFPEFARDHIKKSGQVVEKYFSLGCTAHEYLRVASGRSDFAIYSRAKPWDHLAGALMVEEAGGRALCWDRSAYLPEMMRTGLIVASDSALWESLHDFLIQPIVLMQMKRR